MSVFGSEVGLVAACSYCEVRYLVMSLSSDLLVYAGTALPCVLLG